jgi:hypothetical protein
MPGWQSHASRARPVSATDQLRRGERYHHASGEHKKVRIELDNKPQLKGRLTLDDAWSRLPPGQTNVSRSLLAERILKAASKGERDPVRLRVRAIVDSLEGGM